MGKRQNAEIENLRNELAEAKKGELNAANLIQLYAASTWQNDSQFMMTIIDQAIDTTLGVDIGFVNQQLGPVSRIETDEAVAAVARTNKWIVQKLNNTPYEAFMLLKYFGTQEIMYSYISDIVTAKIYSTSLSMNIEKIKNNAVKNRAEAILDMNKHQNN